jgi:hypothetical protein
MRATHSDVFALKNSGLDAFLYADVGAEANGSTLTILSVLARLGKDPWAEAARWATLPKAAAIECLAQNIAEMPLAPAALAGARANAVQLVQLLPKHSQGLRPGTAANSKTVMPKLAPITIMYFALAVGMALNLLLSPKPSANVSASVAHSTITPEASHPAASSLPNGVAVSAMPITPTRQ